jgi:Pathogenicity locus
MEIPGVREKTAQDLWGMGVRAPSDLRGRDPQELYETLCSQESSTVDRCMLYVFRCAVYYASNESHEPELLKWWNWKDA